VVSSGLFCTPLTLQPRAAPFRPHRTAPHRAARPQQVRGRLGPLDPHFARLADAMSAWIACWRQFNPVLEL
jgi:hypothetical protein